MTCSDLQWLARLKCMTFAFLWYWEPYMCQKLFTKEASSNPDNASLTTLQICITIPCGFSQFWEIRFTLWQLWGLQMWATSSEGGAIASLGSYRCGCAWSSRETSAGESWKHRTRPEDPQNGEGPWHVHKRSWKNWIVFQSLLFVEGPPSFFMYFSCGWGFGGMELMMGSPKNK